jgi:hypothetical protein
LPPTSLNVRTYTTTGWAKKLSLALAFAAGAEACVPR